MISNFTLHQIASVKNQLVEASYKQPIYGKYVPNVTKKVKKIISILKLLRTEFMCVGELKKKIENMEGMLVTEVELGDSLDFLESTGEIRIIPGCCCTNRRADRLWNSKEFMWDTLVNSGLNPPNYDFLVNFLKSRGF